MPLEKEIHDVLESIIDPCSIAAGAPAGLVSMGLVGDVGIEQHATGAKVHVTLYVTEPGCMISAIFQVTAKRKIETLAGIESVVVDIDYGHLWSPDQMEENYRKKLNEYRKCQEKHMQSVA